MQQKNLTPRYVDPKSVVIKEHVKEGQKVHFQYFRDNEFWYKTDAGLLFPISLQEAQTGGQLSSLQTRRFTTCDGSNAMSKPAKEKLKLRKAGSAKLPAFIISSL
jgi:hypothetical protein